VVNVRTMARAILPGAGYEWLAQRYRAWRRLVAYPPGANLRRSDYDAYWSQKAKGQLGQLSAWRMRRAKVFAGLLGPGDRVLDLGTGDGAILQYLIAERQVDAKGLDVSTDAVAFCRRQGLDVDQVDLASPRDALPDGIWDYAILSEVIEHLANPEELLEALRPHVGKALLISVPNSGFIAHRLRLGLGRFPLQWIVWPGEHLRFWTVTDFYWWTERLGFTVSSCHPYEGVRVLMRWWPSLFAAGIVYVLEDPRRETNTGS
jgi:methionine biosynthesis protein MetW